MQLIYLIKNRFLPFSNSFHVPSRLWRDDLGRSWRVGPEFLTGQAALEDTIKLPSINILGNDGGTVVEFRLQVQVYLLASLKGHDPNSATGSFVHFGTCSNKIRQEQ